MKPIKVIGDGAFGSFFKELWSDKFDITEKDEEASSFVLAVPFSAYESVAQNISLKIANPHLINVCSIQLPSTNILLKYSNQITSIHPLFGKRTPAWKRNSILTYECGSKEEDVFITRFENISAISYEFKGKPITPEIHDQIMAKTHLSAVMAAKQLKVFVDRAEDIPDHLIPNSFRLLKEFVKTLEDMPTGTLESIMANPFF